MKTKSFRNVLATASLLAGLAGASSVQANGPAQVVFGTLQNVFPFVPTATDVYRLTCPIGTTGVSANVTDLIGVAAPLVTLQIVKPQPLPFGAVGTTDPIDGFQFVAGGAFVQLPSPTVTLNNGSGQYYLFVDKNVTGVENYRMTAHCNAGATPVPVQIQNQ